MGKIYELCCPKCNYISSFRLGVGFAYPHMYVETQEAGKRGELGDDIKEFFSLYPDGVIDPVPVIAQCDRCNYYATVPSINMYIPDATNPPRKKTAGSWSIAMPCHEIDCVYPGEFKTHYKLYKGHRHICKKCGGKLNFIANEKDIERLKCPNCQDRFLVIESYANWD